MAPINPANRGLGNNNVDYDPVDEKYLHAEQNLILINGCPPN